MTFLGENGHGGTPRDIANVAVFLAGPRSTFMTGQVLGVNGGIVI